MTLAKAAAGAHACRAQRESAGAALAAQHQRTARELGLILRECLARRHQLADGELLVRVSVSRTRRAAALCAHRRTDQAGHLRHAAGGNGAHLRLWVLQQADVVVDHDLRRLLLVGLALERHGQQRGEVVARLRSAGTPGRDVWGGAELRGGRATRSSAQIVGRGRTWCRTRHARSLHAFMITGSTAARCATAEPPPEA